MLPGLGGTYLGMTKEPALHVESPVSKGTQDSEGNRAGEEDTDGEGEESEDMEYGLPISLSMKARRAPILLDFKYPVSMNTVPAGLFKALANGGSGNGHGNNTSAAKENEGSTCRLVAHMRSSSAYLAHPSTTYASPPSHRMHHGTALLQEPPQLAHDCRASLSAIMALCVWRLLSAREGVPRFPYPSHSLCNRTCNVFPPLFPLPLVLALRMMCALEVHGIHASHI
jgi:hypothetical protein